MRRGVVVLSCLVGWLAVGPDRAADWSQIGGPPRNNKSAETGLLKVWPEGGPRLLWTARGLGEGYSSVTRVGDLITTMGTTSEGDVVIAIDAQTGQLKWVTPIAGQYHEGQGNGPRSTPTIVTVHQDQPDKIVALDP